MRYRPIESPGKIVLILWLAFVMGACYVADTYFPERHPLVTCISGGDAK